ncbi:ABC transporter permease subunit [Paenibacillus oralis]|uniref:ABC transporter permease subunit n=1 Tax=Paenibacillus oralis TaxID=2490856 RepID=A0A3P3U3S5_9BACL|nr:ABC transporter permease subunit [Paenibacillus oralis]RRJ64875.1 ABC transporter permease subunit [Paenibacillus oralis]
MMNLVRANKLPAAALLFIVVLMIAGLSASWISPYDPFQTNHQEKLLPPSLSHPFGTDYLGRDLLSRVIHGISDSVFPVFIVLSVVMLIGLFVGALSAFWGNKLDLLMMSVTDIFTALPNVLLTIVVVGFLGFGMENVYLAVILSWWAKYVRLIRGLIHDVKKEPYIMASRVSGSFGMRTIIRHMIPNIAPQLGTMLILDVSKVILTLSGLSFLGIGAQPPSPEWGVMLLDGKNYLQVAPWMGFFPGMMIFLTACSFQIVGERLRRGR